MVEPKSNTRWGGWTRFTPNQLAMWGFYAERIRAGGNPIGICELAMVPLALLQIASHIRNSTVLYFIDNSTALHCLVKGSAKDWYMDRAVALVHLISALFELNVHFEYVESGANWADSLSCDIDLDAFAPRHGFMLEELHTRAELYTCAYCKLVAALKKTLGE